MQGFFVKHRTFGLGKVKSCSDGRILVRFTEGGKEELFDKDAFEEGDLKRAVLGLASAI